MRNFFRVQAFLFCLVLTNVLSVAQSSQMATLLHDGEITNFYSATAFIDALDAAVDGDVISLSSGSFTAKDITKNVSIRGVGYTVKGYNENEQPTVLTGTFNIKNPKSEIHQLTLEGIVNNSSVYIAASGGFTALKCQFQTIHSNLLSEATEIGFIHCIIDNINTTNASNTVTISIVNSVIESGLKSGSKTNIQYTNSVVAVDHSAENSTIVNTVMKINRTTGLTNTSLANSCHVTNSIIINCDKSYATGSGNKHLPDGSQVFADGSFYELKDEYKQMQGVDGTEVGIHGGNMPFTPITSRPRISKFNVAAKTTADGKLSVDIEVKGEE